MQIRVSDRSERIRAGADAQRYSSLAYVGLLGVKLIAQFAMRLAYRGRQVFY